MIGRFGRLFGGMLAAGTVGLTLAPSASAATLPKAIDFWANQPNRLAVRPASLTWTTFAFSGTSSFDGAVGPDSKISWSSWTATGAAGSGKVWVNVVSPNGESSSYIGHRATLALSAPKRLSFLTKRKSSHYRHTLVFTRMRVSFTGAVPAGWHRSKTFVLKRRIRGFYSFAVPV